MKNVRFPFQPVRKGATVWLDTHKLQAKVCWIMEVFSGIHRLFTTPVTIASCSIPSVAGSRRRPRHEVHRPAIKLSGQCGSAGGFCRRRPRLAMYVLTLSRWRRLWGPGVGGDCERNLCGPAPETIGIWAEHHIQSTRTAGYRSLYGSFVALGFGVVWLHQEWSDGHEIPPYLLSTRFRPQLTDWQTGIRKMAILRLS